jgi:hypothetical protein
MGAPLTFPVLLQFVNMACGLDCRAYRLPFPAHTTVYEIDRTEVRLVSLPSTVFAFRRHDVLLPLHHTRAVTAVHDPEKFNVATADDSLQD